MNAIVVYESLSGNTEQAGLLIAKEPRRRGTHRGQPDCQHRRSGPFGGRSGHRWQLDRRLVLPGRAGRLATLPVIDGKKAAVYCTYAINAGKTLSKLSRIASMRGGDIVGGYAIKRNDLAGGVEEFTDRLLGALDASSA